MSDKNIGAKEIIVKGSLIHNPVLVQCAGLCPVIAAAANLKSALMLAAAVSIVTIITCVIASAILKKLPRWLRMPLYLIIGIGIICPVLWFTETRTLINISLSTKIYLPLVAVNSVTAVHCEQFSVKNKISSAFYDACAVAVGSSAVLLVCGALRELIGSSSIGGYSVKMPLTFKSALTPFGGLIILGFLAALLKVITAYRYPEFIPESESIVRRRQKPDEETVEVDVFDEFWNEPKESDIRLDEYDELFDSLDNIFDFGSEEDNR